MSWCWIKALPEVANPTTSYPNQEPTLAIQNYLEYYHSQTTPITGSNLINTFPGGLWVLVKTRIKANLTSAKLAN